MIYSDLVTVEEESEHFSSMERQAAIRLLKAQKQTGALKKKKKKRERKKKRRKRTQRKQVKFGNSTFTSHPRRQLKRDVLFDRTSSYNYNYNWVHRRWSGHDCTNEPISLPMLN